MRYLQTSTKFVHMEMKTDTTTKTIHVKTDGYKMNPCIRDFLNPKWIQNSIKVITALQGAWTRFHNYCYHITTRCMEHPPLHLHYRLLATFKNCPNPFYMTCVHPFCRGNWRGSQNKMSKTTPIPPPFARRN